MTWLLGFVAAYLLVGLVTVLVARHLGLFTPPEDVDMTDDEIGGAALRVVGFWPLYLIGAFIDWCARVVPVVGRWVRR